MRDQLTIGCDAVQGVANLTFATPKDYARWGGELGIEIALKCLAMPRAARRAKESNVLRRVKQCAREMLAGGASRDEADLYVSTYERAFAAQMANPTGIILLEIIS